LTIEEQKIEELMEKLEAEERKKKAEEENK